MSFLSSAAFKDRLPSEAVPAVLAAAPTLLAEMEEYSMRSLASSDFFRILYTHLGGLITAGVLRSLAWLPLIFWITWASPEGSVAGSYGLGALGFLALALLGDPFLAGGANGLSLRIIRREPASPRDALAGLGSRYPAMLAWTWIQAVFALLALYNLLQVLSPESLVPEFLALLATALSLWAWMILRAMNIHLPRLLIDEELPLKQGLMQSFLIVLSQPMRSFGQLTFRLGLVLLMILSGVGVVLGLGSFGILHGFALGMPEEDETG